MALNPEQQQQMESSYRQNNHGFRYPGYPGIDVSNLSLSDYEQLWEKPLSEHLKSRGITSVDQAKSNNDVRPYLEGIFGLFSLNDGAGKIYDYVVDAVYDRTFGDLISHKTEYMTELKRHESEMTSDYEEHYGAKKYQFLKASHYTDEDGDTKGFFFRFWRYPVSKLFDYRNINFTTAEGKEAATQILTDLFGPNARHYKPEDLMNETPEHLVEQRETIEQQKRAAQEADRAERNRLLDQPFHEFLSFSGIAFSDSTDPLKMAKEAFNNPDAHQQLSQFLIASDPFDLTTFQTVITQTPNQIKSQSDSLKQDLTDRTDDTYLVNHPEATFENFLNDRRSKASPSGVGESQQISLKALQKILGTNVLIDNKTVREALPEKCTDLKNHVDTILQTTAKRKRRKMITIISSVSALSALLIFGMYKGAQLTAEGLNTLGDKVASATHYTQEKAKEITQKVTSSQKDSAVSDTTTTATTPASQSTQSSVVSLKGNRPVSGAFWKGWQDPNGNKVEPLAFQKTMTGEFNHLLEQMKQSHLPVASLFNPDLITKRVMTSAAQWQPEVSVGKTPVRFYIETEGKGSSPQQNQLNKENLAKDILNFHFNIQDVLNNIPVPASELAVEQIKTMEAIGPTIGWSIYQQLAWAQKNPDKMASAHQAITKGAAGILKAQKADTSDISAVFKATCLSIKSYRETHPEIQSYVLLADKTIRQIAGIELQDMTQFQHFTQSDLQQANACLERVEKQLYGQPKKPQRTPPRPAPKKGYPWGWIIGTAAVTIWLSSAIMKDQKKIIR